MLVVIGIDCIGICKTTIRSRPGWSQGFDVGKYSFSGDATCSLETNICLRQFLKWYHQLFKYNIVIPILMQKKKKSCLIHEKVLKQNKIKYYEIYCWWIWHSNFTEKHDVTSTLSEHNIGHFLALCIPQM